MAKFRKIIILFLIAGKAYTATSIAMEKSMPDGLFQNAFTKRGNDWVMVKNTNYFNKSELKLGVFKVSNPKDIESALTQLSVLNTRLNKFEKAIPKKAQVKSKPIHQTYYKVGKHTVLPDHPFYKKVKQVYDALEFNSKLKHDSGIALDMNLGGYVSSIKSSKTIEKKSFNRQLGCSPSESEYKCSFEGIGVLFLEGP